MHTEQLNKKYYCCFRCELMSVKFTSSYNYLNSCCTFSINQFFFKNRHFLSFIFSAEECAT